MRKNKLAICLAAIYCTSCIPAAEAQNIPTDKQLSTGKLSNGLTYYIRHNETRKGTADFYLVVKAGSLQEEEPQLGLAHFLEHMAFNGTRNFPGNTMIDVLEKKGIEFGRDVNAATYHDRTVYHLLDIPVSRNSMLDSALLVLHDWAGFLTLDEQEIDKERGVVHEEWRTRSKGETRVLEDHLFPKIYAGTAYANRMPIGSMDVIDHFRPAELRDYYHKWYRPDLQAVIVVGDIDTAQALAKIAALFADIPVASVQAPPIAEINIADNKEPVVAIGADKELTEIGMDVFWKYDAYNRHDKAGYAYYRTSFIQRIVSSLLAGRCQLALGNQARPYSGVNVVADKLFFVANSKQSLAMHIIPENRDSLLQALKAGLEEAERLQRFGFTVEELEKYKKNASRFRLAMAGREGRSENTDYTRKYIANFMQNEPLPGSEWEVQAQKQILDSLTIADLNAVMRRMIKDSNVVFVLSVPDKEGMRLPSEEQILAIWKQVQLVPLKPLQVMVEEKLYHPESVHPVPGHVVKTEQAALGYCKWILSNGVQVHFKHTEDKDRTVLLWGHSPGGLSALPDSLLPSAGAINWMMKYDGVIDTSGKARVDIMVNRYDETAGGVVYNPADFETLLKLFYYKMTSIQKHPSAYRRYIKMRSNEVQNHTVTPKGIYMDTLTSIMSNHNPRAILMDELKNLPLVNEDKMIKAYKERITNARNFTFFITGNINEDSARLLAETYLGALSVWQNKIKIRDHHSNPPKGIVKKSFTVPMKIPQSTNTIGYTGQIPYTLENLLLMTCLKNVLQVNYINNMREKEGGTYSVDVAGDLYKFPSESFIFQINFDTDPARKDTMVALVYKEISRIVQQGGEASVLEKAKQNLLNTYRQQEQNKNTVYLATQAWMLHVYGIDQSRDYEKIIAGFTPEKLKQFAGHIFSQGNIIEVTMNPAGK